MENQAYSEKTTRRMTLFAFAIALMALVVSMAVLPAQAQAKSYTMPETSITANVLENGDLHVVEQRAFNFSGTHTALQWKFDGLPSGSAVKVNSVSLKQGGAANDLSSVPFNLKWREDGGPDGVAYSLDQAENTVYLFLNAADEQVIATVDYTIVDGVAAYSDAGEVYWQFVGSKWSQDSENVTMTLSLPVPPGEAVQAGENVRAWAHGPLDATVEFQDDGTVKYAVPHVSAGKYAEARVVFPVAWLSGVKGTDVNAHANTARMDQAVSEELTWADRGTMERGNVLAAIIAGVLVSLVVLVWGIRSFLRYGKAIEPEFKEEYWSREPVEGEHPAVVGRILSYGALRSADFKATMLHLVAQGAIRIECGTPEGGADGKGNAASAQDYRMVRVPEEELRLNSELDRKAMALLFETVGGGASSIWLSEVARFAKDEAAAFTRAMDAWQGTLASHVEQGKYLETYSSAKRSRMKVVAAALVLLCAAIGFVAGTFWPVVPGALVGIALLAVSYRMERRTQEGANVYARCMALKRWLAQASLQNAGLAAGAGNLNELMVYAYVLGVTDKAAVQLHAIAPESFTAEGPCLAGLALRFAAEDNE